MRAGISNGALTAVCARILYISIVVARVNRSAASEKSKRGILFRGKVSRFPRERNYLSYRVSISPAAFRCRARSSQDEYEAFSLSIAAAREPRVSKSTGEFRLYNSRGEKVDHYIYPTAFEERLLYTIYITSKGSTFPKLRFFHQSCFISHTVRRQ